MGDGPHLVVDEGAHHLDAPLGGEAERELAAAAADVLAEHGRQAVGLAGAGDLAGRGLSRDRVTACAVRLLDLGFFRVGSDRHWHDLHSEDLNEALRRLSGTDVTAKDFRTWHATVLAAVVTPGARATDAARRRQTARAVREVSHYLGNTPAVCRASYIDPKVFELFEQGVTITPVLTRLGEHGDFGRPATQGAVEAAVLDLLDGSGG
ncbi:hypothetical protein [Streptomyces echinatus]|uniref:hypothetical protein n=1 Tax=Streptomyces echinatus TaxID=67293 RepID=UPI003796B401